MRKIILLLGYANDDKGVLSPLSLDRLECAWLLYANNEDVAFLCTGGFGENFNRTETPHASYVKQWLLQKGIREKDFLPLVFSSNTYEDFEKSKPVIEKELPDLLIVVTSDFHMARAKILCENILGIKNAVFVPAPSRLSEDELRPLIEHEVQAVDFLKKKFHRD